MKKASACADLLGSTNFEIHAPHWHGNTVVARHMDRRHIAAADGHGGRRHAAGQRRHRLFHCHTGPHLRLGMVTRYTVQDASATTTH
jgi:hypothetical protein